MPISEVNHNTACSSSQWEQEVAKTTSQGPSTQLSHNRRDILLEQLKSSQKSDTTLVRLYMAMMDEQRSNRTLGGQIVHQHILAEQDKHKAIHKEAQRLHEELEKATSNVATVDWLHSMLLTGTLVAALITVGGAAVACALTAGTILPGGVAVSTAVITEVLGASASWIPAALGLSNGIAAGTRKYYEVDASNKEGAHLAQKELLEKSGKTLDQLMEQNQTNLSKMTDCDKAQADMLKNLSEIMREFARID